MYIYMYIYTYIYPPTSPATACENNSKPTIPTFNIHYSTQSSIFQYSNIQPSVF